ncbi:hypothetical protein K9N68_10785 [Kovacikia minuta CCNUW1]|uniref:hypothetical protein n=1 Tax=Kovacikia minuta TaxID=2931930 RepID=UPI001CCFBF8B|nr:hypothetical protein [Kovacikia minuta]UBF28314.1 hypothetical protein K9N68_10785 [Kovacikia minuta CCNUW1]
MTKLEPKLLIAILALNLAVMNVEPAEAQPRRQPGPLYKFLEFAATAIYDYRPGDMRRMAEKAGRGIRRSLDGQPPEFTIHSRPQYRKAEPQRYRRY